MLEACTVIIENYKNSKDYEIHKEDIQIQINNVELSMDISAENMQIHKNLSSKKIKHFANLTLNEVP